MKVYYLQSKRLQFVVFGKVRWAFYRDADKIFSGNDGPRLPKKKVARSVRLWQNADKNGQVPIRQPIELS